MADEKVLMNAVLVFPVRNERVLLARKTRNIGEGCWNGYGGGIDAAESPQEACVRELKEESGLLVDSQDLEYVATLDCHNTKVDGSIFACRVHTFLVRIWKGEVRSTEEMATPTWFPFESLPLSEMMLADREWLPRVLAGKRLMVEAWYGPQQQTLLRDVVIEEMKD